MKHLVFLLLMIVASGTLAAQTKQITADQLKELLASKDSKYFFLDVRQPKELEEMGTVKGYVNIPIDQLESRLAEVPKDRTIVTFCRVGARAGRAAALLEKHGYTVAGSCGLTEYKAKGYDLIYPKADEKKK